MTPLLLLVVVFSFIDLKTFNWLYVYSRSWHHPIDHDDTSTMAVRWDTLWSVTIRLHKRTLEASFGHGVVSLHFEVIFTGHGCGISNAGSFARMIFVICQQSKRENYEVVKVLVVIWWSWTSEANPETQKVKKHEIYDAAFGGHLFS